MHPHAATPPDETDVPTEDFTVLANVCDRFVECGFEVTDAIELAAVHADWHEAQRLLERGCSHELVVKILL